MKAFYKYCGIALLAAGMCFGVIGCSNDATTSAVNTAQTEEARKAEQAEKERLQKANEEAAAKLKAEKEAQKKAKVDFVYQFIKSKKKTYDQAQQITWVDSISKTAFGHKGVYTYMGFRGKNPTSDKWLRAILHYSGREWVFFNRVIFSTEDRSWTYYVPERMMFGDKDETVVYGGVHESLHVPLEDISAGLRILTEGKNPRIDFYGTGGHAGKKVTAAELKNFKTYLKLEEGIAEEKATRSGWR